MAYITMSNEIEKIAARALLFENEFSQWNRSLSVCVLKVFEVFHPQFCGHISQFLSVSRLQLSIYSLLEFKKKMLKREFERFYFTVEN